MYCSGIIEFYNAIEKCVNILLLKTKVMEYTTVHFWIDVFILNRYCSVCSAVRNN